MPTPWVDGPAILQHVAGSSDPSAATPDEAWADTVAAAINGAIDRRLGGVTVTTEEDVQLQALALQDAAALYIARKSPHGIVSFGPDGDVVRQGSTILRACEQVLYPRSPGIG